MFGIDDIVLGSMVSGGASLLGSVFSSETSKDNMQANLQAQEGMQQQAMQFNEAEAQKNREWQQQMSSTAYQRSRADMQAAGLNPILAAGAGGASTPGGATASTSAPNVSSIASGRTSPMAGIGDAVSKAVSTAIQAKTFDKMTQEIANLQTQQAKTAAETKTEEQRPEQVAASTVLQRNQAENLAARYEAAKLEGATAKDVLDMPEWLRRSVKQIGWSSEQGGKAADLVGALLNSALKTKSMFPTRTTRESATQRTPDGTQSFEERWQY